MDYAIIEVSGKQIWVESGKFYDLNYINGNPGDLVYLNRILFMSKNDKVQIGTPCLVSHFIKTKIIRHLQGRKITVFKIKPKKSARYKKGHRQKLTRILVHDII